MKPKLLCQLAITVAYVAGIFLGITFNPHIASPGLFVALGFMVSAVVLIQQAFPDEDKK